MRSLRKARKVARCYPARCRNPVPWCETSSRLVSESNGRGPVFAKTKVCTLNFWSLSIAMNRSLVGFFCNCLLFPSLLRGSEYTAICSAFSSVVRCRRILLETIMSRHRHVQLLSTLYTHREMLRSSHCFPFSFWLYRAPVCASRRSHLAVARCSRMFKDPPTPPPSAAP